MKFLEKLLRKHAKAAWDEAKSTRPQGSLDDLINRINKAVRSQFKRPTDEYGPWIAATYPDKVVFEYPDGEDYIEVSWSEDDKGNITFGDPKSVQRKVIFEPVEEAVKSGHIKAEDPKKFSETIETTIEIVESGEGKPFKIKATGIEVDTKNENNRRYPKAVELRALQKLSPKLNESAGQGRAFVMQPGQLLGEADHPSDKATTRPLLLETVVKWEQVSLPDKRVILEGTIIPTSKGRDVQALIEAGIPIGVSQRAYGESSIVDEGGQRIEEIIDLVITGFDLVLEPSSGILDVEKTESVKHKEDNVTLEELLKKHPELKESIETMSKAQVKQLLTEKALEERQNEDKAIREALGLKEDQPITEAIKTMAESIKAANEAKATTELHSHIDEACKDLPYGEDLNKQFVEAVKAEAKDTDGATALVESKRKEYDAIMAKARLESKGRIEVTGSVFEKETNVPEYAKAAHGFSESIARRELLSDRVATDKLESSPAGRFAQKVLAKFDEAHKPQLMEEAKLLETAVVSDLSLPYSVSRTIIREAMPLLVAVNIFDFDTTDQAPSRVYFETYSGPETTDENIRKGELGPIERGKQTLNYETLEIAADRLATQISSEALVFAKSQLGEDAQARALAGVIRQIRERIDQRIFALALEKIALVSNNSGGQWSLTVPDGVKFEDHLLTLERYIGVAKTKVLNRYYTPNAIVCSVTNAEMLSNSVRFTAAGANNSADLDVAGFVGRMKALPVFQTTELADDKIMVVNRELVQHRLFKAMTLKGPFPTYDADSGKLIAADQYYVEEFNGTASLIPEKGSYVEIVEGS